MKRNEAISYVRSVDVLQINFVALRCTASISLMSLNRRKKQKVLSRCKLTMNN